MSNTVQPIPERNSSRPCAESTAVEVSRRRPWHVTTTGQIVAFWLIALVSTVVALRPLGLDKDYQNYAEYYTSIIAGQDVNVEWGYKLLSWLLEFSGIGFLGVLFVYAFIAVYSKYVLIRRLPDVSVASGVYFGVLYFLILFPLWELTQIRNAAAVAVCCLAIIEGKKSKALLYFGLAILLHNVSFIVAGLWLLQRYFNTLKYLILVAGLVVIGLLLEYMPYYASYAADVYVEKFNPFSLKVLFVVVTFLYVQWSRTRSAKLFAYYSLGMLFLYFTMARMPAAAVRVADISLFFSILALSVTSGPLDKLYKPAVLIALGSMFTWISYFADARLIDLSVIQVPGF